MTYAEMELEILEKSVPDAIISPFKAEILALIKKFGESGQSGGSAPYVAHAISKAVKKLCLHEPICPITGIDEEWNDISSWNSGEIMYQNKRCSSLFKGQNNKAYYIDAIIKQTKNTGAWHGWFWLSKEDYLTGNKNLMVSPNGYIKSFPFEPKTFYIDVIEEEVAKDDWEMWCEDPKQLDEVWKYYDRYYKI